MTDRRREDMQRRHFEERRKHVNECIRALREQRISVEDRRAADRRRESLAVSSWMTRFDDARYNPGDTDARSERPTPRFRSQTR